MEPLLHPQDRDLEADLLRAGKDVGLSPAAQARLLAALGVTAGVTAAGEAAASTGLVGKLFASKGVLVAASMVSIGAIGAGVYFAGGSEPTSDRPPSAFQQPIPAAVVTVTQGAGAALPTPAIAAESSTPTRGGPAADKEPQLDNSAQPRTTPRKVDAHAGLRDELALLEAVSRATKAGNGALALSHSQEYKRRFPRGKLALEAQVLHIEALALAGNRAEASRLAESFLKRYPDSPVAARIRRFAH